MVSDYVFFRAGTTTHFPNKGTPERIISASKKSKISISTLLIGKGAGSTQAPREADVDLNGVTVDEDAALDAELQALLDAAGTDDEAESEASSTDLDEMEVSPPSSPEFPFGILLPAADQHSTVAAGPSPSANHHTQGGASADTRHFEASISARLGPKPRNIIDLTRG